MHIGIQIFILYNSLKKVSATILKNQTLSSALYIFYIYTLKNPWLNNPIICWVLEFRKLPKCCRQFFIIKIFHCKSHRSKQINKIKAKHILCKAVKTIVERMQRIIIHLLAGMMLSIHCSYSSVYCLDREPHVFLRSEDNIRAIWSSGWLSDFGAVTIAISAKMADESTTVHVKSKSEKITRRSSSGLCPLVKGAIVGWKSGWALKKSISSFIAW